jgi:hypothetical protein
MQLNLVPHPATPPADPPFKVWVNVEHSAAFGVTATTNIWFGVGAPASRFVIPEPVDPKRADDLWQTTCFEAFLRVPGALSYREWNFAPSGEWAAYDFTAPREGRTDAEVAAPYLRVDAAGAWELGLSAVLEEADGTKSYWALAHPNEEKPDFHDPACFAAHLP